MSVRSFLKETKSPYAFWMWLGYVLFTVTLSFFLFSLFFFFLFYVLRHGLSIQTFKDTGLSSIGIFNFPTYVLDCYHKWFTEFQIARTSGKMTLLLFIPHVGIISSIIFAIYMLFSYPVRRKKDIFATIEDINNLDVLGNASMLFGRLGGEALRSKGKDSALIWFGKGLGKTTSIAIPTILEAKGTNIVAIDCSGILPRFTSGFRAKIGKVFNFNWDKMDNPEKGEYYPRWNPLSSGNMPKRGVARNNYIKFIAQYLTIKDTNNYWEKLAGGTLEALIQFFVAKVEQAMANDYFLTILSENKKLSEDEKNILYSYYQYMPSEDAEKALHNLEADKTTFDNYLPIGSWYNVPTEWQGRDLSLAMITDTLLSKYCVGNSQEDADGSILWKNMLNEFAEESVFFGYNPKFLAVFEYLNNLSKKQRWVIFSIVLDSLSLFRKESIRERTSLSDFSVHDIRGIINEETGKKEAVTVYSGAYTVDSAFMTAFFIDMLLIANLQSKNTSSVLFMLDDFEALPRLNLLGDLLDAKEEANISSMFLTNEVDNLNEIYNKDILSELMTRTKYKLISAEDNDAIVQKLGQLSIYDSEANEINMKSGIDYIANPMMAFKSQSYYKLSKDLVQPQFKGQFTKGKYLLLVDGFYDLPIKVDSLFFAKNQEMKLKASLREIDNVNDIVIRNRHRQDSVVPDLIEIIKDAGVDVSSVDELEQYLEKKKSILTDNISKIKESGAIKEESFGKWKNTKKQSLEKIKIEKLEEEDSWWLGEEAFGSTEAKNINPFDN